MTHDNLTSRIALMLAFQSVVSQGGNAKSKEAARRIVALAKLMNEFCDLHLKQIEGEHTGGDR